MMPVEGARLSPGGSTLRIEPHVYGVTPPAAVKVCEYGVPCVPAGSDAVTMVRFVMVMVSVPDVTELPTLSVTLTLKLAGPATVGVPVIVPFELSVRPVGSAPELSVHP